MTTPTRSRPVVPFVSAAVGVVLLAFLVVLVMAKPGGSDSASSPLLGRPAPVVQSTTIDDQAFDLSRRKGSWVVFNFFNSTCVPCRQEHPLLLEFAEEQRRSSNPVEMYTIINDDSDAAVRTFRPTMAIGPKFVTLTEASQLHLVLPKCQKLGSLTLMVLFGSEFLVRYLKAF